jgi:hypothetical protein
MPSNVIGHELRDEIIAVASYPGWWWRSENAIPPLPARYPSHQNVPPTVSTAGSRGRAAEHLGSTRPGSPRRRRSGLGRKVHRRELRARQAGGLCGQHEARQGAVHVERATPHEVTLVRATLAERFVRLLPTRLIRFAENSLGMSMTKRATSAQGSRFRAMRLPSEMDSAAASHPRTAAAVAGRMTADRPSRS